MTGQSDLNQPSSRAGLVGDFFGGLSAMLVALPSAIAFGLVIYAPLGAELAPKGAMAGIMGTVVIGIVASVFGGTARLISAPCAPAAAVLSVFVAEQMKAGVDPRSLPLILSLVALLAGVLQFLTGQFGGGRFIKYIPYPVVAGYLSGVGAIIFMGQLPKFLSIEKKTFFEALSNPGCWYHDCIVVGAVTVVAMVLAPKVVKAVPAAIVALVSGLAAYFVLACFDPSLRTLEHNKYLIGDIGGSVTDLVASLKGQVAAIGGVDVTKLSLVVGTAITLAVLLSMDTLKTCLVLDALTGSRHDSNRELRGQGLGNVAAGVVAGIPGAGTMGATLVNLSSGARTRLSGLIEGVMALAALLLLARWIAWIPKAALAGILLVVAVRMVDKKIFHLLKHRNTRFDFFVIIAVVVSAVTMSLLPAAGVGIALAIVLFLREHIRRSVVRRRMPGDKVFSKKRRLASESAVLQERGKETVLFELQGQLFFGTTDQLFNEIEPHLGTCHRFILDMRRVQSIDYSAVNLLKQIYGRISERKGTLILSSLPECLPSGQHVREYLHNLGFEAHGDNLVFHQDLDSALEWVEERLLAEVRKAGTDRVLSLGDFEMFSGMGQEALAALSRCARETSLKAGATVFKRGDTGPEIYFIRRGEVKVVLNLAGGVVHHLATFGGGDFFGDMSFLDRGQRSADAVCSADTDLYVVSRQDFDRLSAERPEIGGALFEKLAFAISARLRQTDIELAAMEEA